MTDKPEVMTGETLDMAEQHRRELKQLFPGVFTETTNTDGDVVEAVDFERLKAELGTFTDVYEGRRERYGMDWPGKRDCMKLIQEPTRATLKPCREESVDFDKTKNLLIEGDNLEVLKLLQKSYYGKVKMIYIDPPYNTGKEFIYPDNYKESLDTYLAYAGLTDDEGKKFSTNTASEGRFHTKWLNMMYSRLYLARNLLRDDGCFVASIDDAEMENLKKVLNEIYGEENLLAVLVWDRNRKNDAKYFSVGHEYMLVYAKNRVLLTEMETKLRAPKDGVEEVKDKFDTWKEKFSSDWSLVRAALKQYFSELDEDDPRMPLSRYTKVDEKGPYRDDGNINWPGGGGPTYDVEHPVTKKSCKKPTSGWRYPTKERFDEEVAKGKIVFGEDETTVPRVRSNLFESATQVMASVAYSYAQTASNEFAKIFDGDRVFDNPKSFRDLEKLTDYLTEDDSIVMDFFAGSASLAHGVMECNAKTGKNLSYICVQLPEPCDEGSVAFGKGYLTIAEISKERIRRVGLALKSSENNEDLDLGMRVFKLDESCFQIWSTNRELSEAQLDQQLDLHVNNIDDSSTQEEILFELLLKAGYSLAEAVNEINVSEKTIYSIADGALLICLEDELTSELINAVADASPLQFICMDKAFNGNDQLKTNAAQTFKSKSQNSESELVFKVV